MLIVKEEDGDKEMGNHMLLVIVHIETEKGFSEFLKNWGRFKFSSRWKIDDDLQ